MVNAVMDALALLSSLATDLDIMLNDLRSSPSSRLLPPAAHQLHHRSTVQPSSSPLTSGGRGGGGVGSYTATEAGHTSNAYLQSALRANQPYNSSASQQQSQSQSQQQSQTQSPAQPQPQHSIQIRPAHSTAAQQRNRTAQYRTSTSAQSPNRNQRRLNQDGNKLRAAHVAANGADGGGSGAAAGNAAATHDCGAVGLSPEVRRIQKLPLWSYQQKLLQQPQKLHVQLLHQQRATKAIASYTKDASTGAAAKTGAPPLRTTATNTTSSAATSGRRTASHTATMTNSLKSASSSSSSSSELRCRRAGQRATSGGGGGGGTNTATCTSSNWIKATPAANYPRSSEANAQSSGQAQNQFKSSTTTASTASAACAAAGAPPNNNCSNSNAGNNNNNNNNNNNSTSNNRRLPFCGLDSIKGSDNNGDGIGIGGTTNLSFDLSLAGDCVDRSANAAAAAAATTAGAGVGGGTGGGPHADGLSEQFHSLDANESSCCGDGAFEDDMQALLPKCTRLSRDELSQSRTSLVSSSDGGILAEGETSSETSRGSDGCPPCDLGLVERLLLTHPVWFLPGIQRSGAVHFLQGKEEGNFIVRGSSQPNTMAVSVRLPPDTGPYIEHYLIQSNEGILSLESSRFKFDSIPALIAHYAQCCDELPVQLVLPRALRDARNRQQLSSLALLGQEFWRYPMSCPKTNETETHLLDAKSPNSLTDTSGLGATVFSSNSTSVSNGPPQPPKLFSPTNNLAGLFSQAGTPSDTTSSMSSFTTTGGGGGGGGLGAVGAGQHMQLMSPESVDSVILTMSPVTDVNGQRNGVVGLGAGGDSCNAPNSLSTFKSNAAPPVTVPAQIPAFKAQKSCAENGGIRPQRPKPPNTLNLDLRKPPAPPLRWSKPVSPSSPVPPDSALNNNNNFTVTTTVTFSVDNSNAPQFVEVTTPATTNNALNSAINSNATFQTFAKRLSPEGECKDTLSSQGSSAGSRWQSQSSKDSTNSQRKILSPASLGTPTTALGGGGGGGVGTSSSSSKSRKAKARKESKHYQESDILESPQIYCHSTLVDKISDYEDLWSHDPSDRAGLLTSFKPPDGAQGRRPDLLAETPTITSLNANLLSPANTSNASASPPNSCDPIATPTPDALSDSQQLIQFSADVQPRSRTALLLPGLMSQSLSEDQLKGDTTTTEGETTPTAQTPVSRSKQGSPFYAEPADALRQAGLATASILRRSQRGPLLPANHRHSEPPKSGIVRTPMCPLLVPSEIEKIAGSLDELKKKQQHQQQQQQQQLQLQQHQHHQQQQQPSKRARGRFEQWQLDSSWEFMGKQDEDNNYGDYDSEEHWRQHPALGQEKENSLGREANKENQKKKPITVHQIIAKRLPDLNLPELVRCSTPPQQQTPQMHERRQLHDARDESHKSLDIPNGCRLSAYDNVERNYSFCQSFFNGIDSAQSDDGTVFSEPWDSFMDSFMPQDDATITSDTIHLSKCRPAVSEDDTIIEEFSTKESSQDTLKAKRTNGKQKVATILRSPSMRDREILCHPRNKINPYGAGPGDSVRAYTLQLALDQSSTFARNIENFISCTKESREAAPQVVMRNMRQFMNGMKNYLVKHGEGKFQQEVETARSRLKSDEFLNLDAILETVMHQLVVLPLREHLYGMFVDYYTRSGDIQLLAENVKYACGRCPADFGIRATVTPPATSSLQTISNLLLRLQEAELPLDKLELFLCVIATISDATGCPRGQQLGADDFLPILVYVVAKCGFVGAEIEAEFMWGLLQPTLLNGEPGYYLTALCSAVHVLKSFMASENESGTASLDWRSSSLPACSSVLRVIIPDECNGSLQTRTLPVRPHTTTREVCRIIAHKARITNPQDYALFKLVDGEETLLSDVECPQDIRLAARGKHCMLAYKRIDAKIAWPTAAQPVFN